MGHANTARPPSGHAFVCVGVRRTFRFDALSYASRVDLELTQRKQALRAPDTERITAAMLSEGASREYRPFSTPRRFSYSADRRPGYVTADRGTLTEARPWAADS
jgi:hypothetical protein